MTSINVNAYHNCKACSNCGHVGAVKTITPGNFVTELLLWLFCGIGIFYTVWRLISRHEGCEKCSSANLVPLDSIVGKQIVEKFIRVYK